MDALVNNAAILYDASNRGVSVELDEVRRGFETNLLGAWRCAQAFLPMLEPQRARPTRQRLERGRIAWGPRTRATA